MNPCPSCETYPTERGYCGCAELPGRLLVCEPDPSGAEDEAQ